MKLETFRRNQSLPRRSLLSGGVVLICLLTICLFDAMADEANAKAGPRLFPQSGSLVYQGIKPHASQEQLNADMQAYYDSWKKTFLKTAKYNPEHYKISCAPDKDRAISEEHGYAMVAVAVMAGYDPDAKKIFDGLNGFRKHFVAANSDYCMLWQVTDESTEGGGVAIDGDMDMAIGLLLAYQQWGSPEYLTDARNLIQEIEDRYIRDDWSIRSGNFEWQEGFCTRTSDFMLAYFPIYKMATGNPVWDKVEKSALERLANVQTSASPKTGLIPEYIVRDSSGNWSAATTKFADANDAYAWSWNAVRVPWRVGFRYLYDNESKAEAIVKKMGTWFSDATGDKAENIKSVYNLDGSGGGSSNLLFTSCVGPAAMSAGKEALLDSIYEKVKVWHDGNYYCESVALMNMLVMTKNMWLPSGLPPAAPISDKGPNLILNPGFEKKERWSFQEPGRQKFATEVAKEGTGSLQVESAGNWKATYQQVFVEPRTKYRLSAMVKGNGQISLAARGIGFSSTIKDLTIAPTEDWKQYTSDFTSTDYPMLMVVVFDADAPGKTTFVDEIVLVKEGSENGDGK